jgi:hypothetical protein
MHKRDIYWWAAFATLITFVIGCCALLVAIGNWLFPFSPRPRAQATPAQTESVALVPPTRTPTLTSTPLPSEIEPPIPSSEPSEPPTPRITSSPQVIEFDNSGVSIVVYDNPGNSDQGKLRLQFLAGNTPFRAKSWDVRWATKDIVGRWTAGELVDSDTWDADSNGVIELSLEPGDFAVHPHSYFSSDQIRGTWGIQGSDRYGRAEEMIVFPVFSGKTTEIKMSLARLEIGLLSSQGDALKGKVVRIYCQGTDIAGKKIPIDDEYCYGLRKTDLTGIATFTLGAGTYMGYVYRFPQDDFYFYDISLQPGQVRREVFTLP